MKSLRFNTEEFAQRDQFDAWSSWFDRVFEVDRLSPPELGFRAASDIWMIDDGCTLSRVVAPRTRTIRNRTLIRRNPLDPWCLVIGRNTTTTIHNGGEIFDAPPRVPFLVSLGKDMISSRDEDVRLQLYLSRDSFGEIAPILDAASGSVVDGAMGALLSDFLLLLEQRLPDIPEAESPRIREAVASLLAACVAPSPDRLAEAAREVDLSRLERVRRAVRVHLRSPTLAPRLLCRHVGISRSQLYRLLEPDGGVAQYIRRQRLLAAYALLSDPTVDIPITRIAEEFCFADGSSFSRAFRQEFEISPNAVRIAARQGQALPSKPRIDERLPRTRLFEVLRGS